MPASDGSEGTVPGVDGTPLWYRVVGDGPLTLLVPCCGNDADLDGLLAPGRRVVFYDVRNRGRSPRVDDAGRLGFSAEVADVAAVRAALGLELCALLGWSYHAAVVVAHALENPGVVSHLLLAAPLPPRSATATRAAPEPGPDELARLDQLRAAAQAARPARPGADGGGGDDAAVAWCEAWRAAYLPRQMGTPAAFERMAPVCHLPNEQPDHVVAAVANVLVDLGAYDWRDVLRDLVVPTLVIAGEEDVEPIDSAYEWAAALPAGEVTTVPDAGRFPWIEQPGRFSAAVDAFLGGTC